MGDKLYIIKNEVIRLIYHDELFASNDEKTGKLIRRELDTLYRLLKFIVSLQDDSGDESYVRHIIDLYLGAGKHYDEQIKKERDDFGYSETDMKMLDGSVDTKEMAIEYVLKKLKEESNGK